MGLFHASKLAERVEFLTPSVSALLAQIWMPDDWFKLNPQVVRHYAHKAAVASMMSGGNTGFVGPLKIVEIGTRCGYSAAVFSQALPACRILCIDGGNDEDSRQCLTWAKRTFAVSDIDATLVEVDTRSVKSIDCEHFAHVDGDHTHMGALRDLRIVSSAAVILADDYDNPAVAEAVKQFCRETGRRANVYDDGLRKGAVIE
jgi:predicted O-methyltransferase YrrM